MTLAIVTGAARGIGLRIAERLGEAGHTPVLVDLDPGVADAAASVRGIGVLADIGSESGRDRILEAVTAAAEPPGLLINNAGITRDSLIGKMTPENFRLVARVDLGAQYELIRLLADRLVDGGAIVNISSRAQLGNVGQFNYAVAKGGVIGLTRAMALELAPRLRVNAVAPGFVATAMTDAMPDEVRRKVIARIPVARAGEPDDIAEAVAWLADDRLSGYLTGQVLYSCGGRSFA